MNRVSKEYLLDPNEAHSAELKELFRAKQAAFLQAERGKDEQLAEKLKKEKDALITELRMVNPNTDLTELENDLKAEADFLNKENFDTPNADKTH